ncbi:MAG: helix-turn-helix transcriptional regulator [Actinobacteria bacterium]|nr:helix-turn-helix transcriptional regulator [Actinomycetota bacterium]
MCGPVKTLDVLECCTPLAGSSLSDAEARELERLFRVLADRHRLKILNLLMRAEGEPVCVCEFTPTLGLAQPTVSYHLKQLTGAGLLERERRGTFAYYSLKPGALERLSALVDTTSLAGAAHVR